MILHCIYKITSDTMFINMSNILIHLIYIITNEWVIVIFVGIVAFYLVRRRRSFEAIELISGIALTASLGLLLKSIIKIPRPESALIDIGGYGFPSIHSAIGITLASLIYVIFVRHLCTKDNRVLYDILLFIFAFGLGVTRLILGVHSTLDVLGGYVLGIIVSSLVIYFFYRIMKPVKHIKH